MQLSKGAVLQIKEDNQSRLLWKLVIGAVFSTMVEVEKFEPAPKGLLMEILFREQCNTYTHRNLTIVEINKLYFYSERSSSFQLYYRPFSEHKTNV